MRRDAKRADELDPDTLAIGVMLRVLTLRVARIECGEAYLSGLDTIREFVVDEIGTMKLASVGAVDAIRIKAHAQATAEHLLARSING